MTSRINTGTEAVITTSVNFVQRSNQIVSRWLLVSKYPDVCYCLENNVINIPAGDDVMNLCGGNLLQQHQQHRSPLSILFGSAVTSTVTASPRSRSADAPTIRPWRPFSIHEDRPISPAPSLSTTAGGSTCTNGNLSRSLGTVESTVDDQAVPRHHALLRSTAEQQYTATNYLPGIPLVPILLDGLAIDQFHHQRLLSSVNQQVVYPAVLTGYGVSTAARQQCSQCGLVFSMLGDLVRHQQSSCSCPFSSSSSSPTQSGSTGGSPPTRSPHSPSPLLSCPHCDKTLSLIHI